MRVPKPAIVSQESRVSLARTRVARAVALVVACCLLAAACGSDDAEPAAQADDTLLPATSDAGSGDEAASSDDVVASGDAEGDASDSGDPGDDAAPADTPTESSGLDAETLGDRGLRLEGEENPESLLPDPTATPVPTTPPLPTPAPDPEAEADSDAEAETVSVEPTPTPAPTPTPPPQNDPLVAQPPAPQGPVPSDDLEIPGPPTDDGGEFPAFSDSGVLACATTEAAIEFLDRGDLTRTEEALQSAAALASAASEPAVSSLATQLSAAGGDPDASFDAIVAMLSACAQYGYEV